MCGHLHRLAPGRTRQFRERLVCIGACGNVGMLLLISADFINDSAITLHWNEIVPGRAAALFADHPVETTEDVDAGPDIPAWERFDMDLDQEEFHRAVAAVSSLTPATADGPAYVPAMP